MIGILVLIGLGVLILFIPIGKIKGIVVEDDAGGNADDSPPEPRPLAGRVERIARAIATAEGFFAAGSLPARIHNPGALKRGDQGLGLVSGKTVYPDDPAGWEALYHQVRLMLENRSSFYRSDMTFTEIAMIYTGGDRPESWARIVSSGLGLTPQNKLEEVG